MHSKQLINKLELAVSPIEFLLEKYERIDNCKATAAGKDKLRHLLDRIIADVDYGADVSSVLNECELNNEKQNEEKEEEEEEEEDGEWEEEEDSHFLKDWIAALGYKVPELAVLIKLAKRVKELCFDWNIPAPADRRYTNVHAKLIKTACINLNLQEVDNDLVPELLSLGSYLKTLGYSPNRAELAKISKAVIKKYREQVGCEPPKTRDFKALYCPQKDNLIISSVLRKLNFQNYNNEQNPNPQPSSIC